MSNEMYETVQSVKKSSVANFPPWNEYKWSLRLRVTETSGFPRNIYESDTLVEEINKAFLAATSAPAASPGSALVDVTAAKT